jgi:molybdate transport repressor ModE-like protein/molybdopterin-binding protein
VTPAWPLTPTDLRLLVALGRERNVVHAARAAGIPRDRAVYRLRRLERLYRRPVVRTHRGGRDPGGTELTALGRRLSAGAAGGHPGTNRWSGTFRVGPPAHLALPDGATLEVAFRGRADAPVDVEVDPEAIVLSRRPVDLSARNRLTVRVRDVHVHRDGSVLVRADWGPRVVRVAVTRGSVDRLGLSPGRRVYAYVKATSLRRAPGARPATRGSPRS